jgi:DnaJ-class molecular chaperone
MANASNKRTPPGAAGSPPMKPGDEAPAGTPGTGENICPVCHGSGRIGTQPCANCAGTGKVTTGIGGA